MKVHGSIRIKSTIEGVPVFGSGKVHEWRFGTGVTRAEMELREGFVIYYDEFALRMDDYGNVSLTDWRKPEGPVHYGDIGRAVSMHIIFDEPKRDTL